MILTIEAVDASELKSKILDLAATFDGAEMTPNDVQNIKMQESELKVAETAISSETAATEAPATEKKTGRGRPKKTETVALAAVQTSAATPAPTLADFDAPSAATEAKTPTLDDVRAAMGPVMTKLGITAAREIFAEFKAQRFPDLKVEDYAKVIAACNKKLLSK